MLPTFDTSTADWTASSTVIPPAHPSFSSLTASNPTSSSPSTFPTSSMMSETSPSLAQNSRTSHIPDELIGGLTTLCLILLIVVGILVYRWRAKQRSWRGDIGAHSDPRPFTNWTSYVRIERTPRPFISLPPSNEQPEVPTVRSRLQEKSGPQPRSRVSTQSAATEQTLVIGPITAGSATAVASLSDGILPDPPQNASIVNHFKRHKRSATSPIQSLPRTPAPLIRPKATSTILGTHDSGAVAEYFTPQYSNLNVET
jgi:hypothetical protein